MLTSEVNVTAYVLYSGYLAYSISKYLHLPAAVTIFVVGLTYSHYLAYNMPYKCFEASRNSLKFMAFFCESFIFIYLGLSFVAMFMSDSYRNFTVSWDFITWEIIIIIGARLVSFYGVIGLVLLY